MAGRNRLGLLLTAGALTAQAAVAADIPINWHLRAASPALSIAGLPPASARSAQGDLDAVFGGDIGYKRNWLRTDTALGNTGSDRVGRIAESGTSGDAPFDGYLDLGIWYGLVAPAGGAGTFVATSYDASALASSFKSPLTNAQWSFSWAVTAGAASDATPSVPAAVVNRHFGLGDTNIAAVSARATTLAVLVAPDVRVGVRWNLDDVRIR